MTSKSTAKKTSNKTSKKTPKKTQKEIKIIDTTSYGKLDCSSAVWDKANKIPGKDPNIWRKDSMGVTIKFAYLSSKTSKYAWNIDHIIPKTRGGSDLLSNLQPLNRIDNIRFSNKLTRDKPNYCKREHFNMVLEQRGIAPKKDQSVTLKIGCILYARQSPTGYNWNRAQIIYANKKEDKVIVYWIDNKYEDDLPYDSILFDKTL